MSWHYSQALVEACSQVSFSDGEPSVPLKLRNTISSYCSSVKKTEPSTLSQFGTMLERLMGDPFVAAWTLSQQVSRASHSLLLDHDGVQVIRRTCGLTPYVSLGKWSQATSSWKMSLSYLLQDTFHKWPQTWLRAGIVSDGECFQQQRWERRIAEIDSGLLPTPAASLWKRNTCTVEEFHLAERSKKKPIGLAARLGGPPHPEYLEWMMGWPIGWTELSPLEMDGYQEWLDLHGSV